MGKEIVQAVRAGGPDPTSNMRLRDLIVVAKERNVPKDIIDRFEKGIWINLLDAFEE